jgi:hypothetical protein
MKLSSITFILIVTMFLNACASGSSKKKDKTPEISFESKESERRVDVLVDGKLFTAYIWPEDVMKPVLYPVCTAEGTQITRGFPIEPRQGERSDHPHHVGLWFNYGDVEGLDFWNNSPAISAEKKHRYGTIGHTRVEQLAGGKGEGVMKTAAEWKSPKGEVLLTEKSEYHFIAEGSTRIIDRIITLTAGDKDIKMKDNKEGAFAIRVARELELPSDKPAKLTDAHGNPTDVPVMDNSIVSGDYLSSEGVTGGRVWGKRARWMNLYGTFGEEKVALVICDHPKNPGYPTYWHARGYGLFAANALGWSVFTKGKQEFNFSIPAEKQINEIADKFAKKY